MQDIYTFLKDLSTDVAAQEQFHSDPHAFLRSRALDPKLATVLTQRPERSSLWQALGSPETRATSFFDPGTDTYPHPDVPPPPPEDHALIRN